MLLLKTAYCMVGNILVIQTVEKGIFKKQIKQFCAFHYIFKTKNQLCEKLETNLHMFKKLNSCSGYIKRGFCTQDKIGNYFALSIKGIANEKFRHMEQKWIPFKDRQFTNELVRNSKLPSLKSITIVLALIIFL